MGTAMPRNSGITENLSRDQLVALLVALLNSAEPERRRAICDEMRERVESASEQGRAARLPEGCS